MVVTSTVDKHFMWNAMKYCSACESRWSNNIEYFKSCCNKEIECFNCLDTVPTAYLKCEDCNRNYKLIIKLWSGDHNDKTLVRKRPYIDLYSETEFKQYLDLTIGNKTQYINFFHWIFELLDKEKIYLRDLSKASVKDFARSNKQRISYYNKLVAFMKDRKDRYNDFTDSEDD